MPCYSAYRRGPLYLFQTCNWGLHPFGTSASFPALEGPGGTMNWRPFRRHARRPLLILLAALTGLGSLRAPQAWAQSPSADYSGSNDSQGVFHLLPNDNNSKQEQLQRLNFVDSIESGKFSPEQIQELNIAKLANQSIDFFHKGQKTRSVDLNHPQLFQGLSGFRFQFHFNELQKEFWIEAVEGQNDKGLNGNLIGRHRIQGMDVAAFAHDEDLLMMVNSKGEVQGMNMLYIKRNAFRSSEPIPVFQNLWKPQIDANQIPSHAEFFIYAINPGREVPDIDALMKTGTVAVNAQGEPVVDFGDYVVGYKVPNGKKEYLGILARDVIATQILHGSEVLANESRLMSSDEEALKDLSSSMQKSEKVRQIFQTMRVDETTREAMKGWRKGDIDQLVKSAETLNNSKINQRGRMVFREFQKLASDVRENFQNDLSFRNRHEMSPKELKDYMQQVYGNQSPSDSFFHSALSDDSEEWIARHWGFYVNKKTPKEFFQEKNSFVKKTMESAFNLIQKPSTLMAAASVFLAYPFLHDSVLSLQNIAIMDWVYNHYPSVLKDKMYRVPLIASMVLQLSLIPLVDSISWGVGAMMKNASARLQNTTASWAPKMREVTKFWGNLAPFQRLQTMGLRTVYFTTYPFWRLIIETILRQKSYLQAWENGLNPFRTVHKDSDLGRNLQLDKDSTIGLNSPFKALPFLHEEEIMHDKTLKSKIQVAVAEQIKDRKLLSLVIASFVVGSETNIDPATLMMALTNKEYAENFADTEKFELWTLTAHEIFRQISKIKNIHEQDLLKMVDLDFLSTYYEKSKVIAQKLQTSAFAKKLALFRYEFHQIFWKYFKDSARFTMGDIDTLRRNAASLFVSDQNRKELVTQWINKVVVGGLLGPRANLNDPQHLAANPKGSIWNLYTTQGHITDLCMAIYGSFLVSGARLTLRLDQETKDSREQSYSAVENYSLASKANAESSGRGIWGNMREEGFISSALNWTRDMAQPWKSTMGDVFLRDWSQRIKIVQFSLVTFMAVRWGLMTYGFVDALLAWSMFFLSGWYYNFGLLMVNRGSQMENNRFRDVNQRMNDARQLIKLGLSNVDPENSQTQMKTGYRDLMNMYFEGNLGVLSRLLDRIHDGDLGHGIFEQMQADFKNRSTDPRTDVLWGLASAYIHAENEKNSDQMLDIRRKMIQVLSKESGTDLKEIEELSSEYLVELSLSHSPLYNRQNRFLTWFGFMSAGALGMYLMMKVSVQTNEPSVLYDVHTYLHMAELSLAAITVAYLTGTEKAWNFYKKAWEKTKVSKAVRYLWYDWLDKIPSPAEEKSLSSSELLKSRSRNLFSNKQTPLSCHQLFGN